MTTRRDPLADPEPLIRRVYSYVAYRIGPGADAQDVTSDTFERALRVLAGESVAHDGSLERRGPIGYLPQDAPEPVAETILDEVMARHAT